MIVDSSVWLEIFQKGDKASSCQKYLNSNKSIKVPTLVIFELYKKVKSRVSEEVGLEAVAAMSNYAVLDLNRDVALMAGDISLEYNLAMADSVVLAHARLENEELLTLDNDFRKIPGVIVL